jgi:DNA-binding GntR family transcriptional regulator
VTLIHDAQGISVAAEVHERIRHDIIFGRLSPGRKLKLEDLRGQYGASVSTLREVLNRLHSERLVVAEGQKGFSVAPISVANLREVAALRRLLEGRALDQSFRAGGVEWESSVVAAHHRLSRMEARMAAGDRSATEDWKDADWRFHQALISGCPSRLMIGMHAAVFDKYLRYQMIALSYRGGVAAEEHAELMRCALARDVGHAQAVLDRHIEGGVSHALATGAIV